MRPETLRDINRGQVRGWVFLGAAISGALAALSWPDVTEVLIWAGLAALMVVLGVWIHSTLRDTEVEK